MQPLVCVCAALLCVALAACYCCYTLCVQLCMCLLYRAASSTCCCSYALCARVCCCCSCFGLASFSSSFADVSNPPCGCTYTETMNLWKYIGFGGVGVVVLGIAKEFTSTEEHHHKTVTYAHEVCNNTTQHTYHTLPRHLTLTPSSTTPSSACPLPWL